MSRDTLSKSLNPDRLVKPSFSVHKEGTNQTSVGTALELITWPTEEFDANNNFASNRFTPSIQGKYLLSASLGFLVVSDGDVLVCSVYKNGAEYKNKNNTSGSSINNSVSVTIVVDANGTTDYFEIWGANGISADTVNGSELLTWFTGCKID